MAIEQVRTLEFISSQDSIIHNLEGRVKLVAILLIILFCVFSDRLIVPIVLECFLLIMMFLAKLSFKDSFKRVLLLLPFGGFVIAFQPFIHPGNIIWQGPYSWLFITDAGLNWTVLLFARLIVCLTAIVILSSTSPMQEVVQSFYKWRVKQVGYSIAMMFLKAYEKGETVYLSMASRCFSDESRLYHAKTIIGKHEYVFLACVIGIIIVLELVVLFYSNQLAYFGLSLSL